MNELPGKQQGTEPTLAELREESGIERIVECPRCDCRISIAPSHEGRIAPEEGHDSSNQANTVAGSSTATNNAAQQDGRDLRNAPDNLSASNARPDSPAAAPMLCGDKQQLVDRLRECAEQGYRITFERLRETCLEAADALALSHAAARKPTLIESLLSESEDGRRALLAEKIAGLLDDGADCVFSADELDMIEKDLQRPSLSTVAPQNAAPQGSPGSTSGEAQSRIADVPAVAAPVAASSNATNNAAPEGTPGVLGESESPSVAAPVRPEWNGWIRFDSDCILNGRTVTAGTCWGPFEKMRDPRDIVNGDYYKISAPVAHSATLPTSATPRTDAEAKRWVGTEMGYSDAVPTDFARQLEGELQQERQDAARYRWLRCDSGNQKVEEMKANLMVYQGPEMDRLIDKQLGAAESNARET